MTDKILIDRETVVQLVGALNEVDQHVDLKRYDTAPNEVLFDVVVAALTAGRTALAQQREQQGWKRVPVEPTPEMLKAPPNAWEADAKITYAAMLAAAPAPQPAQGESLNLAREVLKLNALWNKSTVQAPEISDQLGICRVLAERVNTDE